jgi:hypothetical protein
VWNSILGHSTGSPLLDAQTDFCRARRAHVIARAGRWLARRKDGNRPLTSGDDIVRPGGRARLEIVPLDRIIGTLEPTDEFDAGFRPASEVVRNRWERIALARRKGIPLPPIVLRQQSDGYYVIDGRHRVSVARAIGEADIDAWVTGSRAPFEHPAERSFPHRSPGAGDAESPRAA